MERSSRFVLALSAGALLNLATAAPAAAAWASTTKVISKVVSFKDLDVATAVGAVVLYNRIVSAAQGVCRQAQRETVRQCRASAVDAAVDGVDSALLTSLHRSATNVAEEVVRR